MRYQMELLLWEATLFHYKELLQDVTMVQLDVTILL